MRIGLLGFGVVGRGVYDLTATRDDITVAKVLCLEDITLPDATVTKDFHYLPPNSFKSFCASGLESIALSN